MKSVSTLINKYTENVKAQDAIRLLHHTTNSVFLTGKAGTGKSKLVAELSLHLNKEHIVLTHSVNRALELGGQTLFSFFGLKNRCYLPEEAGLPLLPDPVVQVIKNTPLIIIDEIELIRCDLMNAIDLSLQKHMGNKEPFGGKQMLLIGDLYQLPPVIDESNKDELDFLKHHYTSRYFFSAKAFEKGFKFQVVELTKVYRQRDSRLVSLLNAVRTNKMTPAHFNVLNENFYPDTGYTKEGAVTLLAEEEEVDSMHRQRLGELPGALIKLEAAFIGEWNLDPFQAYPADELLMLKPGAQVMFTNNDAADRWSVGTIGLVQEVDKECVKVAIGERKNQQVVDVTPSTYNKIAYRWHKEEEIITQKVVATFTQFPLRLAWAMTIRQSQGLTFEDVIVTLSRKHYAAGQAYVGLSRCTSLRGIRLRRRIQAEDIFVDQRVTRFLEQQRTFRGDKKVYADMLESSEQSLLQQQLIVGSLEAKAMSQHEDLKELVNKVVEQSQQIEWLEADFKAAQSNLKTDEVKLRDVRTDFSELQEGHEEVKAKMLMYQLVIAFLAILCVFFMFD